MRVHTNIDKERKVALNHRAVPAEPSSSYGDRFRVINSDKYLTRIYDERGSEPFSELSRAT